MSIWQLVGMYFVFSLVFLLGVIIYQRHEDCIRLTTLLQIIGISFVWPIGVVILVFLYVDEHSRQWYISSYEEVEEKRKIKRMQKWDQ